jgi:hypothetical protein
MPFPERRSNPSLSVSNAEANKRDTTCDGVRERSSNTAAAAATNGAAIEVPDSKRYEFAGEVERIMVPGAAMST